MTSARPAWLTGLAIPVAYTVLPVAHARTGSKFHQAMYVPADGLPVTGGTHPALTRPSSAAAAQRPTVTAPPTAR